MASLKSIKKRIGSVKNTQKITKAMKMVAAAKLRRAQSAAFNARHYTNAVRGLVSRLVTANSGLSHPLMKGPEKVATREYLVLTSDRGLCGGFNGNLLRRLGEAIETSRKEGVEARCRVVGKKGRDYFKSKSWDLHESITDLYDNLDRSVAEELAKVASHRFQSGKADEVWLVYNYFRSAMVQEVTFHKILPCSAPTVESGQSEKPIDYIYEPSAEGVLDKLLNESLVALTYQSFLESIASELAARMTAMDNATNNASDMIGYLTLKYNRARQAAITRDLMDIVNGAEALR